jgi:hypothetical protein
MSQIKWVVHKGVQQDASQIFFLSKFAFMRDSVKFHYLNLHGLKVFTPAASSIQIWQS